MYKFDSREDYLEWCNQKILSIYSQAIRGDSDKITEIISEITSALHLSEGWSLIKE